MKKYPKIMFAGQITGVEGYIESASMGMLAGINMSRLIRGEETLTFPNNTAIGSLARYISDSSITNFQPMNINFGLMPSLKERIRDKREKNRKIAEIAINSLSEFIEDQRVTIEK
jgi:methylenetetrahydrofolate--tRNA-(uracil-5-)-methyltransferase